MKWAYQNGGDMKNLRIDQTWKQNLTKTEEKSFEDLGGGGVGGGSVEPRRGHNGRETDMEGGHEGQGETGNNSPKHEVPMTN